MVDLFIVGIEVDDEDDYEEDEKWDLGIGISYSEEGLYSVRKRILRILMEQGFRYEKVKGQNLEIYMKQMRYQGNVGY